MHEHANYQKILNLPKTQVIIDSEFRGLFSGYDFIEGDFEHIIVSRKDFEKVLNSGEKTEEPERHCSYCKHYQTINGYMYCALLQKKITVRKKPCKDFENYYDAGTN